MKNKGITLIALVVTIIILLILAGITIGMATNGTGLFEKAKEAKEKWQNAQEDEEMQIAKYTNEIDSYIENQYRGSSDSTETKLWEYNSSATGSQVNSGRTVGEITLNDSIENYKEIVFLVQYYDANEEWTFIEQITEERILTSNLLATYPYIDSNNRQNWNYTIVKSTNDTNRRIIYNVTANNKITISECTHLRLLNIKGIK